MNAGKAFALGWRIVPRLPDPVGRAIFDLVALGAWLAHGGGVRQLERNLQRLRPEASRRQLRRLSRAGMRSYMRYYCETFQMPGWTGERLDARVRLAGGEDLKADLAEGKSVVLAVAHTGNWDLSGSWSVRNLGPVVTVVERLEPEELYQEFLAFREAQGVIVVPYEKGGNVFRTLIRHAKTGGHIIPLLADRDLSRGGIEVTLAGHRARVAPGPAALSLATGSRVYPTRIYYERLHGTRRRAAGTPWGTVLDFAPALEMPQAPTREEAIAALTQAWVDAVVESLNARPQSWHMLQKVFVDDLDPVRLAAATGAAGTDPVKGTDRGAGTEPA